MFEICLEGFLNLQKNTYDREKYDILSDILKDLKIYFDTVFKELDLRTCVSVVSMYENGRSKDEIIRIMIGCLSFIEKSKGRIVKGWCYLNEAGGNVIAQRSMFPLGNVEILNADSPVCTKRKNERKILEKEKKNKEKLERDVLEFTKDSKRVLFSHNYDIFMGSITEVLRRKENNDIRTSDSLIINIPYYVEEIEINAFRCKKEIRGLTFESCSLKKIPEGCFTGTSIMRVSVPEGVFEIDNFAFSVCSNLVSVVLPKTLVNIGNYSFSDTPITSITIPKGVQCIGEGCFYLCSKLTIITMPTTLRIVGDKAFSKTGVTSVTIPEGVKVLGSKCFYGCSQLTNITLPRTLEQIGENAFSETGLKTITIPKSVTRIDNECFSNCNELYTVQFESEYITLDEKKLTLGNSLFKSCKSLSFVDLPFVNMTVNINNVFKDIGNMDTLVLKIPVLNIYLKHMYIRFNKVFVRINDKVYAPSECDFETVSVPHGIFIITDVISYNEIESPIKSAFMEKVRNDIEKKKQTTVDKKSYFDPRYYFSHYK